MSFKWLHLWTASACLALFCQSAPVLNGQTAPSATDNRAVAPGARLEELEAQLAEQDHRIKTLESAIATMLGRAVPETEHVPSSDGLTPTPSTSGGDMTLAAPVQEPPVPEPSEHEHSMSMPGGGPTLKISGFADVNLGFGSDANTLIFPVVPAGTKAATSFQLGEFDLFLSSRLSHHISFVSELVIGADQTNDWGLDIERLQVTYKPNPYFAVGAGRYHTSIGFYNTAFHHGTWFQTATGRPFMYFFEDSGGILPVHSVGAYATGLVPHSGNLELHWTAEVSNGRALTNTGSPVQNFLSDKNRKALNLAAFIKPHLVPGLQIGGSYYRDRLIPPDAPHVDQGITSAYAVLNNGTWESLNEVVLLSDRSDASTKSLNSPLMYTQLSRKFHSYRPYFRYQYLNVAAHDPVSIFTGRYQGPSLGLRTDFSEYVTMKAQYNRLYQRSVRSSNGVDLQVAFAF